MTIIWPERNRQVGVLDALGLIGLVGLSIARFVPVARLVPFWGCGFRTVTGWPCPGCGLTRVADHFAHFDFGPALLANPLGFVAACFFAFAVVMSFLHLAFKVTLPVLYLEAREWVWLRNAAIGAAVVNYAVVIALHRLGPPW